VHRLGELERPRKWTVAAFDLMVADAFRGGGRAGESAAANRQPGVFHREIDLVAGHAWYFVGDDVRGVRFVDVAGRRPWVGAVAGQPFVEGTEVAHRVPRHGSIVAKGVGK